MESDQSEELAAILKRLKEVTRTSQLDSGQSIPTQSTKDILKTPNIDITPQPNDTIGQIQSQPQSFPPVVDPSKIVSWDPARRYVIDHIYPNPKSGAKIKQLIKNQHAQERLWWEERETLLAKRRARAAKRKDVQAILKSFGGAVIPETAVGPEDDTTELEMCDKRIYSEQLKMAADTDRSLRAMGIPFYAIKHELVNVDNVTERGTNKLGKCELKEFQRRMLRLLEDLFKD